MAVILKMNKSNQQYELFAPNWLRHSNVIMNKTVYMKLLSVGLKSNMTDVM